MELADAGASSVISEQLDLWQDEVDALPWGGRSPRLLASQIVSERLARFVELANHHRLRVHRMLLADVTSQANVETRPNIDELVIQPTIPTRIRQRSRHGRHTNRER